MSPHFEMHSGDMSAPIRKVLIANRGEIACRIIRTCRRLGISTVAVYSEADEHALHTEMADEVFALGASESAASYLNIEKILKAAQESGADAIHPGYGFLSEKSDFAAKVVKAGLKFIGPSAEAIALLGDKLKAKELAKEIGVPLAPSLSLASEELNSTELKNFADQAGFPLIIKAAGGGGGRGMRKITSLQELETELQSARREAQSFFGDKRVFIEKLLSPARHVEVQVVGDSFGTVLHLWDRDCTFQRHHQKVIEEAPAPGIPEAVRTRMLDAACALCARANYQNAGTVEFLLGPDFQFYFMEVNSRLQVEHPVTELITGVDLVALQIRIVEGERLQDLLELNSEGEVPQKGSAIELRVCAESPEEGFLPSSGTITDIDFFGPRAPSILRIDSGYREGDVVSHYYDSLLAKVIVHSDTRDAAIDGLWQVLDASSIFGVTTNLGFLHRLISSSAFQTVSHHITLATSLLPDQEERSEDLFLAASLALASRVLLAARPSNPHPWEVASGFRIFGNAELDGTFQASGETFSCGIQVLGPTQFETPGGILNVIEVSGDEFSYEYRGQAAVARVARRGQNIWLRGPFGCLALTEVPQQLKRAKEGESAHSQSLVSPLPGKVISVRVAVGNDVKSGDTLIVIESMKMEHPIRAPLAGRVQEIMVQEGAIVQAGMSLVNLHYSNAA